MKTRDWGASALLGACFAVLAMLWNHRPALWLDEVATLSAAYRSLPELASMLRTVDLVHAFYYVVMHGWVGLAGTSAFWLRLPSALFVGLTVVALHRVVLQFTTPRTAVVVAAVGGCLPRVLWAGSEAREQAMAMALASLATLALLRARRRGGFPAWLGYGLLLVAAALSSMFAVFLVPAHLVWAWLTRRHHPWRATALAASLSILPVLPWVLAAKGQSAQVSWIGARTPVEVAQQVLIKQFFYGDDKPSGFDHGPFTLGLIVLLAACQFVLVVRLWLRRRELTAPERELALLALVLVVLPLVLLLAANAVMPVYVPRYLTWSTPWLAVLVVLGARGHTWPRWLLTASCLAALLLQLPMRQLVEAPPNDYRTVARDAAASGARSYLVPVNWLAGVPAAYPEQFEGMRPLSFGDSAAASASLYPQIKTPAESVRDASGTIFLLAPGTARPQDELAPWTTALRQRQCHQRYTTPGETVSSQLWECP